MKLYHIVQAISLEDGGEERKTKGKITTCPVRKRFTSEACSRGKVVTCAHYHLETRSSEVRIGVRSYACLSVANKIHRLTRRTETKIRIYSGTKIRDTRH